MIETKEYTPQIEVYDIEVFPNFFCYTGINILTDKVVQYRISSNSRVNQLTSLICHMSSLSAMIGFNNVNYDYPILHYLMQAASNFAKIPCDKLTYLIYLKSQFIIESEYSAIRAKDVKVPQIDLYRIHHFDNKAKRTSLKDLEIAMQFSKVEDLPYGFNHMLTSEEENKVMVYNINDVEATREFYNRTVEVIRLRQELGKQFRLNLINHNDPKIGADIFAKYICENLKINIFDLKNMRTNRPTIDLKECILPFVKFKSKEFNKLLDKLKSTTISKTKNAFSESVIYKGFKYDFGTGGIHGCVKPGVYISNDEELIETCDVTSLYPNLSIKNNFYPEHLGEGFVRIYETIFNQRDVAKKAYNHHSALGLIDTRNKAINEGLKLGLNGVYGKSNDQYSFFFDPKFTMQITINGQLLLAMLAEDLSNAGFKVLMINTDGLECVVPREEKLIYHTICAKWQQLTKLSLEFDTYDRMIIRDVNNYISITKLNKRKYKGTFEINKAYHKDPSNKIRTIALSEYFIEGIPIEDTIRSHTNILDFCLRFKATHGWRSELRTVNSDATLTVDRCQKTNRYFVSNKGGTYLKVHDDGREEQIEAGWYTKILNNYDSDIPLENYNINYEYYINETKKVINVIENKQLILF